MRIAFAALIALHGLIHLIGPAKAFGWGSVTQLRQPISTMGGMLWLLAAILLLGSAIAVAITARWWSYLTLPGALLSQLLIVQAWSDARFGTLANIVIAVPLVLLALDARAGSFRSRFASDRAALLSRPVRPAPIVTDADIAVLPPLMQTYLRRVGAVGRPRVRNMRIAGLVPMVDQRGPEMTRSETVTLLNDIVVMAPAAALDLPFTWETLSDRTVRATFSNAGYSVSAVLTFDAAGDLVGFVSNDRSEMSGKVPRAMRWSTPISGYVEVNGVRIGTKGDANWIEPGGEWTYGKFTIRNIEYNVTK